MRYQAFVRAVAGALATAAFTTGAVFAQGPSTTPAVPQPATMTDTAPMPAHDRSSVGAVILMDEPVLAQREMLMQAQERTSVDTRAMGAGPSRLFRGVPTKKQPQEQPKTPK